MITTPFLLAATDREKRIAAHHSLSLRPATDRMNASRHFAIQLQVAENRSDFGLLFIELVTSVLIKHGGKNVAHEHGQRALTVRGAVQNARQFWTGLRQDGEWPAILRSSNTTIVVCEGHRGWDDYVILYHSDPLIPAEQPPD